MQRARWTGILIVALAAAAAPASAQSAGAEEAEAHFRRGNELYKQRRWAEAEAAYEEAFRRTRAHDIAANLGYAELRQGKHREAAEHLSFAVRSWAPTGSAEKKRYAEERLSLAKREVGALRIQVSAGGAEVLVDGARVGVSPLDAEVFVEAGAHAVEARRAGYRAARESVRVAKEEEREVALVLEAMPAGMAMPEGRAEAGSVAGDAGGVSPAGAGDRDGLKPRKELLIAGGALTGAALVAGVVLTVVANMKAGAARDQAAALVQADLPCPREGADGACLEVQEALAARDGFSNAAVWSFVGAGVLGVSTGIYAVAARRPERGGVRVTPAVGVGSGALIVRGEF